MKRLYRVWFDLEHYWDLKAKNPEAAKQQAEEEAGSKAIKVEPLEEE